MTPSNRAILQQLIAEGRLTQDQAKRVQALLNQEMSLQEALSKTPLLDPIKMQLVLAKSFTKSKDESFMGTFPLPTEELRIKWKNAAGEFPTLSIERLAAIKGLEEVQQRLQTYMGMRAPYFFCAQTSSAYTWKCGGNDGTVWTEETLETRLANRLVLQLMVAAKLSPKATGHQEGGLVLESEFISVPIWLRSSKGMKHLEGHLLE